MESTAGRASPSGPGTMARLVPTVRPWAHLSPDLLLAVSKRLDDAGDFVRFHAVCTPWRAAAPWMLCPAAACPVFSPWLLGLSHLGGILISSIDFEEASDSRSCYANVVSEDPAGARSTGDGRNWVASAGGTSSWLLVASPEPSLIDLLTGAVTQLPPFTDDDDISLAMENARGIVYRDRTLFLYRFSYEKPSTPEFTAAILRPADTSWTVMKRILEVPVRDRSYPTALYHDGKVLICLREYFWSVLTTHGDFGGFAELQSRLFDWSESEKIMHYSRENNHVLESQGELLWASVLLDRSYWHHPHVDLTPALSVTIHVLEKEAGGAMRWRVRDGRSFTDRILFLGSPASFAVNAHKLGMSGGCVYFVYTKCVFRYCLVGGKTELVKQLPLGWDDRAEQVWIWRQPTIAPIQEIRERLGIYPNNTSQSYVTD
uniref:Uncharacterized protein n=1 Tax=Avena sativa TaxID=4498 RepID=A0ACD5XYH8_AVESA